MTNTLKSLANELDNGLGAIGCSIQTLSDVEVILKQLVDSMNMATHKGEEKAYYQEHHRTVRVLAELMHFTVAELDKNYERSHELHNEIFENIMRKEEKSQFAANELTLAK